MSSVTTLPSEVSAKGRRAKSFDSRWDWGYVLRRIGQSILIVWACFTIVFIILYLLPGDPAQLMLGGVDEAASISPEEIAEVNARYGFDKPIIVQYFVQLFDFIRGDWGQSFRTGQPVLESISASFGSTAQLVGFGLVLGVILGLLVGSFAAYAKNPAVARFLETLPSIGASLPTFWVGLLLMQFLSFQLHLLPSSGDRGFPTLIMPGIAMAIPAAASIAQVISKSLRTAMSDPYIDVARAKGNSEVRVFLMHAYRNGILPAFTVLGLITAAMLVGATITETVFARRGMGFLLEDAISTKDIPIVMGVTVVIAGIYVIINLVVDLVYPFLDPRVARTRARLRKSTKVVTS